MSVREQIEAKRDELKVLCSRLGISGLTVRIDGDAWDDITFVGDVDANRLKGYAARFFDLEDGLVRIFHRPVRLIDLEGVTAAAKRDVPVRFPGSEAIELLHAS